MPATRLPRGYCLMERDGGGEARVLLVLGKGGVGRTTTTALLAHGAHAAGLNVLVVTIDGKSSLHRLCPGEVDVRSVTAGSALEDYLLDQGFETSLADTVRRIEVVKRTHGHDLVVGKVKRFAISVSTAVSFLMLRPQVMQRRCCRQFQGCSTLLKGPIREQALDVHGCSPDAGRCGAVVVTKAETTQLTVDRVNFGHSKY